MITRDELIDLLDYANNQRMILMHKLTNDEIVDKWMKNKSIKLSIDDKKVCVRCGKNPPYIQNDVCQECLCKQGY